MKMKAFTFLGTLAFVSGIACYHLKGPDVFLSSLLHDLNVLLKIVPRMAAALLLASLVQILLPRSWVSRWLGAGSGLRGLTVATLAGALTIGGPMTSFPLVAALAASGADFGATVAYLTGWALLGLNRVFVWELPLLGTDFVLLRLAASLFLPFLAGWIARRLAKLFPRQIGL